MSFSGKCFAKMFSLKKYFVGKCIFQIGLFCERCRESGICFT